MNGEAGERTRAGNKKAAKNISNAIDFYLCGRKKNSIIVRTRIVDYFNNSFSSSAEILIIERIGESIPGLTFASGRALIIF